MRMLPIVMLAVSVCWAQDSQRPAITEQQYRVFRADGTPATLDDVVQASRAASVSFLGETHDDPVSHHLELALLQRLAEPGLTLSLEMFERDVQPIVDEYLAGLIIEEHLISGGRAWKSYKTDYKPLIEFAKERKLPVVAANAPRRYVNRVSRLGPESLSALDDKAKALLPPLPYAAASRTYGERFEKVMEEARQRPGFNMERALAAQSLWDASMAYAIADSLRRQPQGKVLHINGSFHTEQRLGIVEHLERYRPGIRTLVVTMMPHKAFPQWDNKQMKNAGDFVIVTDASRSQKEAAEKAKKTDKHWR